MPMSRRERSFFPACLSSFPSLLIAKTKGNSRRGAGMSIVVSRSISGANGPGNVANRKKTLFLLLHTLGNLFHFACIPDKERVFQQKGTSTGFVFWAGCVVPGGMFRTQQSVHASNERESR